MTSRKSEQSDQDEVHAVAVAGIVRNSSNHVLLMKRRDHRHWEPPGGSLKAGEDLREGLEREIREETEVEVSIERLSGIYQNPEHGVLSLVFLCHADTDEASTSDEASAVEWCSEPEAINRLSEGYAQWIRDSASEDVSYGMQRDTVKGASSSPHSSLE
jgi:8-oxo-dGTP diphosphatase